MSKQLQSRQATIIQISKKVHNLLGMNEINLEENDSKKEEIFESGGIDDGFNVTQTYIKGSKKQSKLLVFLAKIDETFQNQMQEFLLKNREEYESRMPKVNTPRPITLYEDIMIIWAFKKAEQQIRRNKKVEIDKLTKELQQTIKKSQVTIKERIEKKLANLTVEQLRYMMKMKKDISFGDKKQLIIKNQSIRNQSKSNFQNEVSISELTEKPKPVAIPMVVVQKAVEKKKEERSDKFQSKLKMIEKKEQSKALPNGRVYKYGKKQVKEPIKILYNAKAKSIIVFKKSQFENYKNPNQSKIEISSEEVVSSQKVESKADSKEISESVVEVKAQSSIKINRNQAEQINQYLRRQKAMNDPQYLSKQIEQMNVQTQRTLAELEAGQQSEVIKRTIQLLKNKLRQINQMQEQIKPKPENQIKNNQQVAKVAGPDESDIDDSKSLNEQENNKMSKIHSTGKKTLPEEQSVCEGVDKSVVNKQTDKMQVSVQFKNFMSMLCQNANYLQIIRQDPSKMKLYVWYEDEDNILYGFSFSPNNYRSEIRCLMRYKSYNMVLQRCRYLKIDEKVFKELQRFRPDNKYLEESQGVSQVKDRMQVEEKMQIEVMPANVKEVEFKEMSIKNVEMDCVFEERR